MSHHHHHHHHESEGELSFDERLLMRLEHWLKHNEDHAATYREWADKLQNQRMEQTASLLNDAAELTLKINQKIEAAIAGVKGD